MAKIYLSLGSNIGDRNANLKEALSRLENELGSPCKALSSMVETKSWGFEGADFINCAACFESDIAPEELLAVCKKIEREMGREEQLEFDSKGNRIYHDRIVDIDILLYGDEKINLPHLQIPHPQMRKRDFVMGPLMEIFD